MGCQERIGRYTMHTSLIAGPSDTVINHRLWVGIALFIAPCVALDNGQALRPPMGWRNWNAWHGNVNQSRMEQAFDALAARTRLVRGVGLASLADIGYNRAGLDDFWQACGTGVNGSFHDQDGHPLVNTKHFPDLKAMVAHATQLNLYADFYSNNCGCNELESLTDPAFLEMALAQSVDFVVEANFSGIKLDGCGPFRNLSKWSALFNASKRRLGGVPMVIEDCHWGQTVPSGNPNSGPTDVFITACDNSSDQQWLLRPALGPQGMGLVDPKNGVPYVTIVQASTGRQLTVDKCARAMLPRGPGGQLTLMSGADPTCGGANQRFQLQPNGTITVQLDGSCLNVYGGGGLEDSPWKYHTVQTFACGAMGLQPNGQWLRNNNGVIVSRARNATNCLAVGRPPVGPSPPPFGPSEENYCTGLGMPSDCPYSMYRTAGDVINSYEDQMYTRHKLLPYLGDPPLSRPGAWAFPDGLEVGRFSGPWAAQEDQTVFGTYCITSSPLILGHDVTNETQNAQVWDIVTNTEAIAVNQDWSGHPGRLVKSWDPPGAASVKWPLGRALYSVPCDVTDATQLGWRYNESTGQVHSPAPNMCIDASAADDRQVWVADCGMASTGAQRFKWTPTNSSGYSFLTTGHRSLTLMPQTRQNSVELGSGTPLQLTESGQLSGLPTITSRCVATRSIAPVPVNGTLELWAKPLKNDRVAVLIVNNGLPTTAEFYLSEIPDLRPGEVRVRDVWAQTDLASIPKDGRFSSQKPLLVHESVFLILQPTATLREAARKPLPHQQRRTFDGVPTIS